MAPLAAALMARWSQENFFKYMREHYGLDRLVEYGTEDIPATVTVLNPAWRELDRQVRKQQAELKRYRQTAAERELRSAPVGVGDPALCAAPGPLAGTDRSTPARLGSIEEEA